MQISKIGFNIPTKKYAKQNNGIANLKPIPYDSFELSFGKNELGIKKLSPKEIELFENGLKNIRTSILSVDFNKTELDIQKDGRVKVPGYKNFENDLNDVLVACPEFKDMIGRGQYGYEHAYTLDRHCLKVLQNIIKCSEFNDLNESDKKVMTIVGMLHDLCKEDGFKDKMHPEKSATAVSEMIKRIDLTKDEEDKIYKLIKTHHWLERTNCATCIMVNGKIHEESELYKVIDSVANDLKEDNYFELSKILCKADLCGVRKDSSFYYVFRDMYDNFSSKIQDRINELKAFEN